MADDLLDQTLLLKLLQRCAGNGAVDLESIHEGGNGDEAVRLHIFLKAFALLLVENDGVLGLVLDYKVCLSVSGGASRSQTKDSRLIAPDETKGWLVIMRETSVLGSDSCGLRPSRSPALREEVTTLTYPCPWTTSSFASCHRLLLVPWLRCLSMDAVVCSSDGEVLGKCAGAIRLGLGGCGDVT